LCIRYRIDEMFDLAADYRIRQRLKRHFVPLFAFGVKSVNI